MTGRERSIFACLTDAVVAPAGPLPPVSETDALAALDRHLAASPALTRLGLRGMLLAVEVLPRLVGFPTRMRRLPRDERRRALARIDAHPVLGALTKALRTLAHLTYYGDATVMRGLGYDPEAVVVRGAVLRARESRW